MPQYSIAPALQSKAPLVTEDDTSYPLAFRYRARKCVLQNIDCYCRRLPLVPDTLGFRKRIGIVVPSTNTTVQPECEAMRPRGVTNHTGRSTIKERPLNTEQAFFEHMQAMREGTGSAIDQIMTTGVDHLIMGVALETFWGGVAA